MRTIYHNIGSIQTMVENDSLIAGKSIIVKDNLVEDIVESTDEFDSSDAQFVDVN